MMTWSEIADELRSKAVSGRRDVAVRGVQYDSRRVSAGDIFVGIRGEATDGNRYIDQALQRGAAAVVTDSAEIFSGLQSQRPELALALVEHGRRAMAQVSAAVFGHPERMLRLSAVTGTNGKTTTAFLLEQMLASVGRKSVLIGTIETHVGEEVRPSEHTTPESRDVLALFAEGIRAGCTEAVMEMSSHALDQERVWGLPVDVAVFTNLTQDHLDYHGTMETYAAAKAKLFAGLGTPSPRVAVVNVADPWSSHMINAFRGEWMMTYGVGSQQADYRAVDVRLGPGETHFVFVTPHGSVPISSPLTGYVNVLNLVAASCSAIARGLTLNQIANAAAELRQVPGRFEVVPGSQEAGFTAVVDYAHTPDALTNLVELARGLVHHRGGRVITLFGCGGDRDRTKRPKMGRAAAEASDLVIVTSDNPRSEQPSAIIEEILAGVRETGTRLIAEEDRRAAVAAALHEAKPGDIVLLAGKGHEKTQVFAHGPVPFDDVGEAAKVLREINSEVRA